MTNSHIIRTARTGLAVLGLAAVAASATGCGPASAPTGSDSGGAPSGKLEILVSSASASDAAFKTINEAFMKKYPDVDVTFSASPNENFNATRSSRLTAGNLDITLAQPREVPSYVTSESSGDDNVAADAGLFVDLTNEAFMKNYTPTVLDAVTYKGKVLTVPTGLSYYTGVFYNKDIFAKNNLEVPTTWTEFETVIATLQSAGVTPIGIGGKDSWPAGLAMNAAVQSLYPSAEDKSTLAADLWSGDAKLDEGKQLEVLQRVQSVYDAAQKNFAGVGYDAIPGEFAKGSFAMTVDGTWNQTTIDGAVGGAFDYGYFPLPTSDDAADNALLGGKVELRLVAASNAPNKDAAMAYLEFFSDPEIYAGFIGTTGFAPAQPNIEASAFLTGIADYTGEFAPAWDTIWMGNQNAGPAASFPFNYPAIAPLGTGSAADAAKEAQTAWAAGL